MAHQDCDTVQDRLLTGSLHDIDDIAPHLAACARCRALHAAALEAEDALRSHMEVFVSKPTPPRRRVTRYGVLVGLALAATLALAAGLPDRSDTTQASGPPPAELVQAREAREAFDAVRTDGWEASSLTRADEDAALREALRAKADALEAAEAALVAATASTDPRWRVTALEELASLYEAMSQALVDLPRPSYLNPTQALIYDAQLRDKSDVQLDKALAVLGKALHQAEAAGDPSPVEALHARIERLTQRIPTPAERKVRLARASASITERRVGALLDLQARCDALGDEASAIIRDDLEEIRAQLAADDFDDHADWADVVATHTQTLSVCRTDP